jgi:hypothetical protein
MIILKKVVTHSLIDETNLRNELANDGKNEDPTGKIKDPRLIWVVEVG